MPPLDDRLTEILRAIQDRLPRRTPDWTDQNDADPGTTLLALFAQLADDLLQRAAQLPAAGRAELARLGRRLAELDRDDDPVDVRVNGERWRRVESLGEVDAGAAVFELDPERGTVRFGDGRHGRRPDDGARVTVRYREGSGASGAEVTLSTTWPPRTWSRTVASRGDGTIRVAEPDASMAATPEAERVAFFTGQLLTAADFQAEQDYVREKLRRLTRATLGTGIVSGLTPTVSSAGSGTATLTIAPGVAITPSGELLVVPDAETVDISAAANGSVIQLSLTERPARFVPAGGEAATPKEPRPTRIVEAFAISIVEVCDPRAVALGRLMHDGKGWQLRDAASSVDR